MLKEDQKKGDPGASNKKDVHKQKINASNDIPQGVVQELQPHWDESFGIS